MNRVVVLSSFKRSLKPLLKKYRSFGLTIQALIESLRENPLQGTEPKENVRKLRVAIAEKNKGKSAGARVITYVVNQNEEGYEVRLLYIYDKSDVADIDDSDLATLVELMEIEMEHEDREE